MRQTLAALLAVALCTPGRADEGKKDPSKSNLPLRLKLVNKGETYKALEGVKKQLDDAKTTGRYPAAPSVNMALEITNTSTKEVEFWVGGDPVTLALELKGPGAVSAATQRFFTRIFIAPKPMKLAAGKTHTIPLTKLQYGFRGVASSAYWTEPGEYTLAASFNTTLKPAPEGAKPDAQGFARVTLKSEPVKIKVEK